MNLTQQRTVQVYADWQDVRCPTFIGLLIATPGRSHDVFSFEYDTAWLKSDYCLQIDPGLRMFTGPQYPSTKKANFGVFLDSSPDRWGRLLMDRREALQARNEGRARRSLRETDYLLGVYDAHRMGGLRFRLEPDGPFLDDNKGMASPPWTSLRALERASLELECRDSEENDDYEKWLHMLLAPGGSLGGARPKAGVLDARGCLWIAKFPAAADTIDVGKWEYLAHELSRRVGVEVAEAQIKAFNSPHHTFLTKRFDRTGSGSRKHYASAMTLVNRSDGDDAASGASYLEIAEVLERYGAQTDRDLEQLWRRIVLNVCVSNVDDHLRNHGFLLGENGWRLSPAFDVNPVAYGDGLKLNISDTDNAQDLGLVLEVAEYFRVQPGRANQIVGEVTQVAKGWRALASSIGLSKSEQDKMSDAFRVAEAY